MKPIELMTQEETAQYLGVTAGTLTFWRSTGRHQLPFVKIGAKVRYRRYDLDEWVKARTNKEGKVSKK